MTREASIHVDGLHLMGDIGSDGSNVGANAPGSLVAPGSSTTYTYYAAIEGTHLAYSMGLPSARRAPVVRAPMAYLGRSTSSRAAPNGTAAN